MITKDKTLLTFIFLVILGLTSLASYIYYLVSNIYIKPPSWILSQGLYSSLAKQELLLKESDNGIASLSSVIKIATSSVIPKPEAIIDGENIYLHTGPLGEVAANIPQGEYKVSVVPIPGVDFTNVPTTVFVNKSAYELLIGVTKGSGKVKSREQDLKKLKSLSSSTKALFVLKLFTDQNGNSARDKEDQPLKWAGVVVRLNKI